MQIRPLKNIIKNFSLFFDEIQSFFIRIGKIQNLSEKQIFLSMYFQVFQYLTQKELAAITPYSAGTISETLRKFEGQHWIQKTLHPKSNSYEYRLVSYALDFSYPHDRVKKNTHKFRIKLLTFLEQHPEWREDPLLFPVYERLTDLCHFLEFRENYITFDETPTDSSNSFSFDPQSKIFPLRDPENLPENFEGIDSISTLNRKDPKRKLITDELVPFLENDFIIQPGDQTKNSIFAWFLVQEVQTQESLAELLQVSLSTVSRNLIKLIEMHFIEEYSEKVQAKKIYRMEPMELPRYPYSLNFLILLSRYLQKFQELKAKLINPQNFWLSYEGFPYVYTIISRIILQVSAMIKGKSLPENKQINS